MKNSNDIIGNQTRDLPACSTVPQQTALPRAPTATCTIVITANCCYYYLLLFITVTCTTTTTTTTKSVHGVIP